MAPKKWLAAIARSWVVAGTVLDEQILGVQHLANGDDVDRVEERDMTWPYEAQVVSVQMAVNGVEKRPILHGVEIGDIVDDSQGEVDRRWPDRSGPIDIILLDVQVDPRLPFIDSHTARPCGACAMEGGTATWATCRAAVVSVGSRSMTAEAIVRG